MGWTVIGLAAADWRASSVLIGRRVLLGGATVCLAAADCRKPSVRQIVFVSAAVSVAEELDLA